MLAFFSMHFNNTELKINEWSGSLWRKKVQKKYWLAINQFQRIKKGEFSDFEKLLIEAKFADCGKNIAYKNQSINQSGYSSDRLDVVGWH